MAKYTVKEGFKDGATGRFVAKGASLDMNEVRGRLLVDAGYLEAAEKASRTAPETATRTQAETADAPKPKKRSSKKKGS